MTQIYSMLSSLFSQRKPVVPGRGWFEKMDVQGVAKLCFTISLQGQSGSQIWIHNSFFLNKIVCSSTIFQLFSSPSLTDLCRHELKGEGLKRYFHVLKSGNHIEPPSSKKSFTMFVSVPLNWSLYFSEVQRLAVCNTSWQSGKGLQIFSIFQDTFKRATLKRCLQLWQLLLINIFVSLMSISALSRAGKARGKGLKCQQFFTGWGEDTEWVMT